MISVCRCFLEPLRQCQEGNKEEFFGKALILKLPGPKAILVFIKGLRLPVELGIENLGFQSIFQEADPGWYTAAAPPPGMTPGQALSRALSLLCIFYAHGPCINTSHSLFSITQCCQGNRSPLCSQVILCVFSDVYSGVKLSLVQALSQPGCKCHGFTLNAACLHGNTIYRRYYL